MLSTTPWLRTLKADPDPVLRLVCFHHAGGSAGSFQSLAKAFGDGIEITAMQSPGRQERRREPCLTGLGDIVEGVLPAVVDLGDRPIALFGHSFGAVVAFEVARELPAAGIRPQHLFVSGRRAPSRRRLENVHRRTDAEIRTELRLLGGPGVALLDDDEVAREFLPAIRSDYRAVETHVVAPDARVDCALTALVGDHDPRATVDEARAWRVHTTASFELKVFGGGHFYLVDHSDRVAAVVERRLGTGMIGRSD
ncbi:thioesterase II family protein [Nocardia jiangsuensis]|uniref:Thioesterase TesA n=1 Tax=Nocardia jiangsuensis TaxID=1691563 RepID=A0ABV8DNE6_9NOCA